MWNFIVIMTISLPPSLSPPETHQKKTPATLVGGVSTSHPVFLSIPSSQFSFLFHEIRHSLFPALLRSFEVCVCFLSVQMCMVTLSLSFLE